MNLIEIINQLPLVKEWQSNLEKKAKRQLLIGLSGSAKALVMVATHPVDEVLSAEMAFASPEARAERVSTLQALSQGENGIYVVPAAALRKYLPSIETWRENQLHWKIGSEVDLENLAQRLV